MLLTRGIDEWAVDRRRDGLDERNGPRKCGRSTRAARRTAGEVRDEASRTKERSLELTKSQKFFMETRLESGNGTRGIETSRVVPGLRRVLCTPGPIRSTLGLSYGLGKDVNAMDNWARDRWEGFLLYLLGALRKPWTGKDAAEREAFKTLERLIEQAGLVKASGKDGTRSITEKGFQFLLQRQSEQLWLLLQCCLMELAGKDEQVVAMLSLLLESSCLAPGAGGVLEQRKNEERKLLRLLSVLGLVMMETKNETLYIFTPMTALLCSGQPDKRQGSGGQGHRIVVETNFRLYAYTTSRLLVTILTMFCREVYRLPALFVGELNREAAKVAFRQGIKAMQIVSFLQRYESSGNVQSVLPDNVIQQLFAWEDELNRVRLEEAVLYTDFTSDGALFNSVARQAKELQQFLWKDAESMRAVVALPAHRQISEFIKQSNSRGR